MRPLATRPWTECNLGSVVSLSESARGRPACVLAPENVCKFMKPRETYPATLVVKLLPSSRGFFSADTADTSYHMLIARGFSFHV